MPNPAEATRLYQAALEERRYARQHADEPIPSEAIEALDHLDAEVSHAHADLMNALWTSASTN